MNSHFSTLNGWRLLFSCNKKGIICDLGVELTHIGRARNWLIIYLISSPVICLVPRFVFSRSGEKQKKMIATFIAFALCWASFSPGASAMHYDEATSMIEFDRDVDWKKIAKLYEGKKPNFGPPSEWSDIYPRNLFLPNLAKEIDVDVKIVDGGDVVGDDIDRRPMHVHHIIPRTWINHKVEAAVQLQHSDLGEAFWYTDVCERVGSMRIFN